MTPRKPFFEIFSLFIRYEKGMVNNGKAVEMRDINEAPAMWTASPKNRLPIE